LDGHLLNFNFLCGLETQAVVGIWIKSFFSKTTKSFEPKESWI